MSSRSIQPSPAAVVVTTNPDADCSPEALREFLEGLFVGAEPELDNIDAAQAVRDLRDNVTA